MGVSDIQTTTGANLIQTSHSDILLEQQKTDRQATLCPFSVSLVGLCSPSSDSHRSKCFLFSLSTVYCSHRQPPQGRTWGLSHCCVLCLVQCLEQNGVRHLWRSECLCGLEGKSMEKLQFQFLHLKQYCIILYCMVSYCIVAHGVRFPKHF